MSDFSDKMGLVLLVVMIILFVVIVFVIADTSKRDETIKECFMQEIKTKECEFVLWKYQNSNRCGYKN